MTSAINNCQMQIENILVMVNAYVHNNDFVCDRNKYMQGHENYIRQALPCASRRSYGLMS
jgi:uncharacterized Fe-S cluster-containing radical SAM superfamily enzyme